TGVQTCALPICTQNEGVVPGNTVTRTSVNVGGNATLDNGFYTSGSLNYVKTDQETPPIGGTGSVMGNLLFLPSSYDLTNYPFEHPITGRSEEHTSELQSRENLVCRLLLEKKKTTKI